MKHTFGHRLDLAATPDKAVKDLLGHKHQDISAHYSSAGITALVEAANKVCVKVSDTPLIRLIRTDTEMTQIKKKRERES